MTTDVRQASVEQLDLVAACDAACFEPAWTRSQWRDEFESHGVVFLAVEGSVAIGHACASILDERCELRRIGVASHARRRGVGRDLTCRVIDHARLAACTRVELEVAADNAAAISLYLGLGFRTVGVRPRYYRAPTRDGLLMDLALTPDAPRESAF